MQSTILKEKKGTEIANETMTERLRTSEHVQQNAISSLTVTEPKLELSSWHNIAGIEELLQHCYPINSTLMWVGVGMGWMAKRRVNCQH